MLKLNKKTNVIIYPHCKFSLYNGGIIAQYQLAKILSDFGLNVRIHPIFGRKPNNIFNLYYYNDFSVLNSVVIYCEAIKGNPLKAPKVVRWMLSGLGKNVKNLSHTWNPNDLVYYFNSESAFEEKPTEVCKLLTNFYVDPIYKNLNLERSDNYCYTMRKFNYFKPDLNSIVKDKRWFEVKSGTVDYLKIFNSHKYFISYDPLTFMNVIAALCGCISIVNPCDGMTKKDWYENTCFANYLKSVGLTGMYGVAYGMEDLQYAIDTIDLLPQQILDLNDYYEKTTINPFIEDINEFNELSNTVRNNFQ